MIHIQFLIVFNCFFFLRIFPSFFFFLRKINSHSTFYIFFRTIVLRMVKILYLFTILRKIARFIRISYIGKWMYVIMMRRKIIYGLIYMYNKKNITEWIWLRRFGRSVCWRCRCRWCWLVEWNAATAPIGRRAEVRSIAWLEPPVPGRASYGKLLRLCIVREAPKLQTACLRYFSPSVSSRFFPSCVGLLFVNTVIDSSLWFCFLPHRISASLTVAPESSLRRRCFFPAVKSTTWTLRIFRPPPGVVTCFYCDWTLLCSASFRFIQCPFRCFLRIFLLPSAKSTREIASSLSSLFLVSVFFFFFFLIFFPLLFRSSFLRFLRFSFTFCIACLEFIAYSYAMTNDCL